MKYRALLALFALCCLVLSPALAADGTFDSNGVKIRFVTEGQGEAVVLIHGWMGDSSMWGRDLFGNTKLKGVDGFQVIALDCRGHGKSDKPHDVQKYGAEMAADVLRLLDHLRIEKAHLIGYSSGAFIAGNVAANHPGRILSVVYGGQAPLVTQVKPDAEQQPVKTSEVEIFAKAVADGKGLGPYLMAVWPADKPKPSEEQANAIANFMYGGKDLKAFVAAGRSFGDLEVTEEQLKRCTAPILFIHGGNESASTKKRVVAIQKMLDRGVVKVIEGGDHVTTLAKPEFGIAIKEFLETNKSK